MRCTSLVTVFPVAIALALHGAPALSQASRLAPQEMEVLNVVVEPESGEPVVLLRRKADGRPLAMVIDPAAALAIMLPLRKVVPPRPYTHDLLFTFIRESGYSVEKVVITDIRDGIYLATIVLRRGDRPLELDSRPSDAIALALRAGVPILAEEAVLRAPLVEKRP